MNIKEKPNYNPLDQINLENPYQTYRDLRENHPIFYHERMDSWVLTRYDDCEYVLRNPKLFALDKRRVEDQSDTINRLQTNVQKNLQSLDPPENQPIRSLMMKAFNSQDIESIRQEVREHIIEIFDKQTLNTEFDFMKEVSAPLSLRLTATLLGVPEPNLEEYMEISEGIAHQMDSGLLPENFELGERSRERLKKLVEYWYENVGDTGILPYIKNNHEKAGVPSQYIYNTTGTMFNASFGTLYATFGNVLNTLLKFPNVLDGFKDKGLLSSGVDELIRYDGPAQGTSRFAVEDTTIRGKSIKRGEIVLTLLAAANHDPEMFQEPDKIILNSRVEN